MASNVNPSVNYSSNAEIVQYLRDEIDGLEAAKEIENNQPATRVPTTGTSSTGSSSEKNSIEEAKTADELQKQIDLLKAERAKNIKKIERIEKQIETLAKEAKEEIKEAAAKAEKIAEENKEQADKALESALNTYIEANKKEPGSMTKKDLSALIRKNLPDNSELAKCLAQFAEANEKIDEIDSLLGSLNLLILDTNMLDKDIASKTAKCEEMRAAEEAAAKAKSCDPIGFVATDKNGVQAQYDFIVDDGAFDTTSDFLGSQNQWAEMQDLDADGNGTVSGKEMQDRNIKMVKTVVNPDGTKSQTIVDPVEEFGEDFSIDLNSYQRGGSHEAVDTTADFDNDGIMDQTLLGTFSVNLGNGQNVSGYNTLDDVDFLEANYGIENNITDNTSINSKLGEDAQEDLLGHANFFERYTVESENLKTELALGLSKAGVSQATTELLRQSTLAEGQREANIFLENLEKELAAEEEAEKEAAEATDDKEVAEEVVKEGVEEEQEETVPGTRQDGAGADVEQSDIDAQDAVNEVEDLKREFEEE